MILILLIISIVNEGMLVETIPKWGKTFRVEADITVDKIFMTMGYIRISKTLGQLIIFYRNFFKSSYHQKPESFCALVAIVLM